MKFGRPDSHSVLLIDIASSSVGIGLAGIRSGALPELALNVRVPFAHREGFDMKHLETAMLFALKEALGAAFREGPGFLMRRGYPTAPNHAVISFSSPWFISDLGVSAADFRESLKREYGQRMEVFENEAGLVSAAEKRLIQKIEDEVLRAFGIKEGLAMQSFTFSFAKVLDKAFPDLGPAMYVDHTGHMTDVLTKRDVFEHSLSLPLGHHHVGSLPRAWSHFWQEARRELPKEVTAGNVFFITDTKAPVSKDLLASALPGARVVSFMSEGPWIREMVVPRRGADPDARLSILATYSNLFL